MINCVGRFYIQGEIFLQLAPLWQFFLPIEIKWDLMTFRAEVTALSPLFEPRRGDHHAPPLYQVIVSQTDQQTVEITVKNDTGYICRTSQLNPEQFRQGQLPAFS